MKSKGVTPVVAVVLLMGIAIAATTTAYEVIINTQEDAQTGIEDDISQREVRRQSDTNIETIYNSGGKAYISVRNTGSVSQNIENQNGNKQWTLTVDGRITNGWTIIGGTKEISPESTVNIETNVDFPSSGQEKRFKLVDRYGNEDTYFCQGGGDSC